MPFGNIGTRYSGLGLLVNPFVNAGVQCVNAEDGGVRYLDDYHRPRGNLMVPLLTLHTTMDPDVPFAHEAAFAKASPPPSGLSGWLSSTCCALGTAT